MMMIRLTLSLVLLHAALTCATRDAPSIFLPRDAEVVNIVGDGFKLQVTQLNRIKNDWNSVAQETAKLDDPRKKVTSNVDANLYEQTKEESGDKVFGPLYQDLQEWIELRALQLTDKIDSFENELESVKDGQRVVVQILLMNTMIDLENLSKENIKSIRRIKNKLRSIQRFKADYVSEVENWIKSKIFDNLRIEKSVKGTNNPGEKWMTNTQAIMRILHEQRFSEKINKDIVDFLGGKFSMMDRARVYEINKTDKKLDDGLYYKRAKGRVPAHFPFSVQEAIVNEA